MVMFRFIGNTPVLINTSEAHECFTSPIQGPFLITASRASHPLEETLQSGAAGWKALLLVHLWTQQETGRTSFILSLLH